MLDENLIIACKSNSIQILEIQREGKNKQTAKEFNLPYKEYKTTRKAIAAHFKFLKEMGMKPAMQA